MERKLKDEFMFPDLVESGLADLGTARMAFSDDANDSSSPDPLEYRSGSLNSLLSDLAAVESPPEALPRMLDLPIRSYRRNSKQHESLHDLQSDASRYEWLALIPPGFSN